MTYFINPYPYPSKFIQMFNQLKLCLATATHNFYWVKITHSRWIWSRPFTNFDIYTVILSPITVIISPIKIAKTLYNKMINLRISPYKCV